MELSSLTIDANAPPGRTKEGMSNVPIHSIPGSPGEVYSRDRRHSSAGTIFDGAPKTAQNYIKAFKASMRGLAQTPAHIIDECQYLYKHPRITINEILCGLTMSIIVVPESISFAYMVDFSPMAGMYATFFICFFCAILGARPAMISGCAGSMCAILKAMSSPTGVLKDLSMAERHDAILMTVFFIGIVQLLVSWLRLAQYTKLLPQSTMIGFVNGLAIVIFESQLHAFKRCSPPADESYAFSECPSEYLHYLTFYDAELLWVLLIFALCTLVIFLFPKMPVLGRYMPSTLIALLLGAAIEHGIVRTNGYRTRTLGDTAPLDAGWPSWHFPSVSGGSTWGQVLIYACYTAAVGTIESVMTVQAMCEVLGAKVTDSDLNRETFAQGVGNLVSGLFGAIGGCGTIGESNLNLINGSRHRLSAIVSGWCVLFIVVWLSPIVNLVPIASLAAAILCVTIHTFYWPTLWTLHRMRKHDALIVVVVTLLAVFTNLALAMGVGFVIAALNNVLDGYFSFSVAAADVSIPEDTTEHDFYYDFHPRLAVDINADDAEGALSPPAPSLVRTLLPRDASSSRHVASPLSDGNHDAGTATAADALPVGVPVSGPLANVRGVVRVYRPQGLLFFGSARHLKNHFAPAEDPLHVVLDFSDTHICDLSASMAVLYVVGKYVEARRRIKLVGLDNKSRRQVMRNTELRGMLARVGEGEYRCRSSEEYQQRREERNPWTVVRRWLGSNGKEDVNSSNNVSDGVSPSGSREVAVDMSESGDAAMEAAANAMITRQHSHSNAVVPESIDNEADSVASGGTHESSDALGRDPDDADDGDGTVVMDMGVGVEVDHGNLRHRKHDANVNEGINTEDKRLYNLDMLNPEE